MVGELAPADLLLVQEDGFGEGNELLLVVEER